jgi:hypothetical protein
MTPALQGQGRRAETGMVKQPAVVALLRLDDVSITFL